jgi:putative transposase
LHTLYPKAKTTVPNKTHKKYPYLLNDIIINKPNQVWPIDITYIKMRKGFCYLVAIINWYSRKILSYKLSNCLDCRFCIAALNEALAKYPAPEMI